MATNDNNTIRVIRVAPGEMAEETTIGTDLSALQEAVGGYIEFVYPFDGPVGLLCNEEAKLIGLPPCRGLFDGDGNLYDIVCGDFYLVGLTDDGDIRSLTNDEVDEFGGYFALPERFFRKGGEIIAMPYVPAT